jgi:hypothetical protein
MKKRSQTMYSGNARIICRLLDFFENVYLQRDFISTGRILVGFDFDGIPFPQPAYLFEMHASDPNCR